MMKLDGSEPAEELMLWTVVYLTMLHSTKCVDRAQKYADEAMLKIRAKAEQLDRLVKAQQAKAERAKGH